MQGSRFGSFTRTLDIVQGSLEEPLPLGMMPWKHIVRANTGLLDFTTKHLCFSGPYKQFRARYDRIVDFHCRCAPTLPPKGAAQP